MGQRGGGGGPGPPPGRPAFWRTTDGVTAWRQDAFPPSYYGEFRIFLFLWRQIYDRFITSPDIFMDNMDVFTFMKNAPFTMFFKYLSVFKSSKLKTKFLNSREAQTGNAAPQKLQQTKYSWKQNNKTQRKHKENTQKKHKENNPINNIKLMKIQQSETISNHPEVVGLNPRSYLTPPPLSLTNGVGWGGD